MARRAKKKGCKKTLIEIRRWQEDDFPAIQQLSQSEGWTTPTEQENASFHAWQSSFPALVAVVDGQIVGFLRAISDRHITTFVAELLVAPPHRGQGIATTLLDQCQQLCPQTKLELLASPTSQSYYKQVGFRQFVGFRRTWAEKSLRR
jgi:GNAT superfamily N-acetyltransferase